MLKKLLLAAIFLTGAAGSVSAHTILGDAANITRGILNPLRLDASSVTMFGNGLVPNNRIDYSSITAFGNGNVPLNRIDYSSITAFGNGKVPADRIDYSSLTTQGYLSPLNVNEETVSVGGLVTTLNCAGQTLTCTQSGSTATLTGSLPSGLGLRPYDLIVGSNSGVPGIDMVVNTRAQFNMMLTTVQALGMTHNSTATATILFRNGLYDGNLLQGVTVPAGINLVAGSSVVWVIPQSATQTLVTIYGTMDGFKFDNSNSRTASRLIRLGKGGSLLNFEYYNSSGIGPQTSAADISYCTVCVDNSSGNFITGKMYDMNVGPDNSSISGSNASFKVTNSTFVDIQFQYVRPRGYNVIPTDGIQSTFMLIFNSNKVFVHDSILDGMGSVGFALESKISDIFIERNTIFLTTGIGRTVAAGFFMSDHQLPSNDANGYSTGTISISDNRIFISTAQTQGTIFVIGSNAVTDGARGWQVKNNRVSFSPAIGSNGLSNGLRFATVNAQSNATLFQGNNVNGLSVFISDSGDATLYQTQGNTLATVAQ